MLKTAKAAIRSVAHGFGYEIVQREQHTNAPRCHERYERVFPQATYAPWNTDSVFLSTYDQVKHNTLVDIYRCWELWTQVEYGARLGGNILEVGVWRGGTGALMAKKAAICNANALVFLCDTFRGVVKAGPHDDQYKGGEHADTSSGEVEALVHKKLGLHNVRILEGVFPDDSANLIDARDCRFGLCHIDVDVYQSAKDIMAWLWDRLLVGGTVVYDDYGFNGCNGITTFVNEQRSMTDRCVLHNLNGHAVVVKIR